MDPFILVEEETKHGKPGISIAVGILVGLAASFVQSLGLTIQRKSHLQNDALPVERQKKTWKRPLWLFGFAVFISSNLFGTVFQIGALPIVVLAPLGAVSLLWNSILSRLLLRERFSTRTLLGTLLIASGASLIAIFGVVPEENHSLKELLRLFGRRGFLVYISLMGWGVAGVLVVSHAIEIGMHRKRKQQQQQPIFLPDESPHSPDPSDYGSVSSRIRTSIPFRPTGHSRRWSAPIALPTPISPKAPGSPIPGVGPRSAMRAPVDKNVAGSGTITPKKVHYRDVSPHEVDHLLQKDSPSMSPSNPSTPSETRKTTLLALSFAACSGTLSGMSLLFAKCAVELLIITVASHGADNQFKTFQSWVLLVGLGATALAQLYYLNHSLKLASPALICPLAFCFYNISSIFDGLVFYSQFSELSPKQIALVTVGIAVLLVGVWSVSAIRPETGEGGVHIGSWADERDCSDDGDGSSAFGGEYTDEPEEDYAASSAPGTPRTPTTPNMAEFGSTAGMPMSPRSRFTRRQSAPYQARYGTLIPELAPPGLPAGFSIGFNVSSPGFTLRTNHQRASMDEGEGSGWIRHRSKSEPRVGKRGMSLDIDAERQAAMPISGLAIEMPTDVEAEVSTWTEEQEQQERPGLLTRFGRSLGFGRKGRVKLPDDTSE